MYIRCCGECGEVLLGEQFCWRTVLPELDPPPRYALRCDLIVARPRFGIDRFDIRGIKFRWGFLRFPKPRNEDGKTTRLRTTMMKFSFHGAHDDLRPNCESAPLPDEET